VTYLLLGVPFVAVAAAVWFGVRRRSAAPRLAAVGLAFAGVAALTAVFDNAIIAAGVVGYAGDRTLGVRLGLAPLEDWLYPVAGVMLLPALWVLLGRRSPGGPS
jgi:lycopene cyclase domain-containing protein